jgi:hypothetical protein
MKSLTLHAMDDQLAQQIKLRANELSISMNELAKRILAEGLGIKAPAKPIHRDEFSCFCGIWTEDDIASFNERVADMDAVDLKDWQ